MLTVIIKVTVSQCAFHDRSGLLGMISAALWYKISLHSIKMSGGALSISPKKLETIPIPKILETEKQSLMSIVNMILEKKKNNLNTDTSDLEKQINAIVYNLYKLNKDDIKIIEDSK